MSCQEFEFVSVELARGSLLEAAARESALAHAGGCRACAARLRRERALTAALRETAASMSERETPARVEAALLAALRERRRGAATAEGARAAAEVAHAVAAVANAAVEVVSEADTRAGSRRVVSVPGFASGKLLTDGSRAGSVAQFFAPRARRAFFASAVAASLLVVAFVAWRAHSSGMTTSPRGALANNGRGAGDGAASASARPGNRKVEDSRETTAENPLTPQSENRVTPKGEDRVTPEVSDQGAGDVTKAGERYEVAELPGSESRGSKGARQTTRPRVRGEAVALPISFRVDGGSVTALPVPSAQTGGAGAADIASASDFMPLGASGESAPLDSGQMVRVEVPRAALAAFGLPVNGARAGETVRADVLLAHDGTARAIRLLP